MSNEAKYKAALEKIIAMQPKQPNHLRYMDEGDCISDFSGGNIDDAYYLGVEKGNWEASEIALDVLGIRKILDSGN